MGKVPIAMMALSLWVGFAQAHNCKAAVAKTVADLQARIEIRPNPHVYEEVLDLRGYMSWDERGAIRADLDRSRQNYQAFFLGPKFDLFFSLEMSPWERISLLAKLAQQPDRLLQVYELLSWQLVREPSLLNMTNDLRRFYGEAKKTARGSFSEGTFEFYFGSFVQPYVFSHYGQVVMNYVPGDEPQFLLEN